MKRIIPLVLLLSGCDVFESVKPAHTEEHAFTVIDVAHRTKRSYITLRNEDTGESFKERVKHGCTRSERYAVKVGKRAVLREVTYIYSSGRVVKEIDNPEVICR